ncbi:MAG TPA: DUF2000 family protein [Opitutaceae bacterium]|nr:DUF2000 family protein [Opitutaceae bacterium]
MSDTTGDFRLVAILNKRVETGKAMNALAHCVAGVTCLAGEPGRAALKFIDFVDFDSLKFPSISARSFIILRGAEGELRKVHRQACEGKLPAVAFLESMTGGTYTEQLERTKTTPTAKLSYYAVALVGSAANVNPITKKYSLWRSDAPAPSKPVERQIDGLQFTAEEKT